MKSFVTYASIPMVAMGVPAPSTVEYTVDWSTMVVKSERDYRLFLDALRQVETGGYPNEGRGQPGDDGKAIGPYQIWKVYWTDAVERNPALGPPNHSYTDCLTDKEYSEKIIRAYMKRYAGKDATFEKMARIHNGGPNGHKKTGKQKGSTDGYWKKVRIELDKLNNKR